MSALSPIPTLAAGRFFGTGRKEVQTPSFQFAEMDAALPASEVPRHTHETPHFILVLRGAYVTEARHQNGHQSPATLIFNPAGTTHRDRFRGGKGRFLSISPAPEVSKVLAQSSAAPLILSRHPGYLLHPVYIAQRIRRELEFGGTLAPVVLEGLGLELIGQTARLQKGWESRYVPDWLLRARQMIEDHDRRSTTVAGIAEAVAVHPVYLARAFRLHFGCSPGELIRGARLARIQQLLTHTRLPLAQIALECGFSEQSQMTHSFTRAFGVPPGQYRQSFRK